MGCRVFILVVSLGVLFGCGGDQIESELVELRLANTSLREEMRDLRLELELVRQELERVDLSSLAAASDSTLGIQEKLRLRTGEDYLTMARRASEGLTISGGEDLRDLGLSENTLWHEFYLRAWDPRWPDNLRGFAAFDPSRGVVLHFRPENAFVLGQQKPTQLAARSLEIASELEQYMVDAPAAERLSFLAGIATNMRDRSVRTGMLLEQLLLENPDQAAQVMSALVPTQTSNEKR